jgi:PGF-CTERM protein
VITIDISVPEAPPRIDNVSRTPEKPTSKEIVTVTLVTSGTTPSYAEITYTEGTVAHPAQKMAKSGNTFTYSMGPFKADTLVKYTVTAYTASGKSNRSAEYSFTVKAAPAAAQPTPGLGALVALVAMGAMALVVRRRRI